MFGIPVAGTHAHAFVTAFQPTGPETRSYPLKSADGSREVANLLVEASQWLEKISEAKGNRGANSVGTCSSAPLHSCSLIPLPAGLIKIDTPEKEYLTRGLSSYATFRFPTPLRESCMLLWAMQLPFRIGFLRL